MLAMMSRCLVITEPQIRNAAWFRRHDPGLAQCPTVLDAGCTRPFSKTHLVTGLYGAGDNLRHRRFQSKDQLSSIAPRSGSQNLFHVPEVVSGFLQNPDLVGQLERGDVSIPKP